MGETAESRAREIAAKYWPSWDQLQTIHQTDDAEVFLGITRTEITKAIVAAILAAEDAEREACELAVLRERDKFSRNTSFWKIFNEAAQAIGARSLKATP